MKKTVNLFFFLNFVFITNSFAAPTTTTEFIKIDQFGYRNNDQKIAVISDPVVGYNASLSFTPGTVYQIRDWFTDALIFSGNPIAWNGGAIHDQSGDRVWYYDFSTVTTSGSYYVFDVANNVGSYRFEINDCVYNEVLKQACRSNYYQRCGSDKALPYTGASWADGVCHKAANQDLDCRLWNDPTNTSLSKDLSGGWHDAGDHNKYVNLAWEPVLDLLLSYEQNSTIWTDDYNIPESGNGIPDILDDVKYELEWLKKMQNSNGSVLCVVGSLNRLHVSGLPTNDNTTPRFYGKPTTHATLCAAGMFALASIQFNAIGQTTYATDLRQRAINAWTWAIANPSEIFVNNPVGSPPNLIQDDYKEVGWVGHTDFRRIVASAYLFAATGNIAYKTFFDTNYANINPLLEIPVREGASSAKAPIDDAYLYYAKTVGGTLSVQNEIRIAYINSVQTTTNNLPSFTNQVDAYRAYIADFNWDTQIFESVHDWGSNFIKGHQGSIYENMTVYNFDTPNAVNYKNAASGFVHYFHGVNPLSKTYLSNMINYGAENSVQSFYHGWFNDGTIWDVVTATTPGPPPGFTVMGANERYDTYTCCATNCETNCDEVANLLNDPAQKCYKDFNSNYPFASWTVTENQIAAQASYIRLLSKFCTANCSPLSVSENDIDKNKFQISPNPSSEFITILFSSTDKESLEIYNSIGQLVKEISVSNNSKIDVSNLSNGIYFVKMKNNNPSLKLIKK